MENNGQLKRILIATVISFVFFVAYDYFVLTPQQRAAAQQAAKTEKKVSVVKKDTVKKESIAKTEKTSDKIATVTRIEAGNFEITVDSLGRISSFVLKQNKFNTKKGKHLELVSKNLPKPLEMRFENAELNKEIFSVKADADKKFIKLTDKPETLTLVQKLKNNEVVKKITFYPDGHYDVKISLAKPALYYISPGYRPDVAVDKLTIHGLVVKKSDGTLKIVDDGDAENETVENAIFAAEFDRYYTTLLFSKKPFSAVILPDSQKNPTVFIKADGNRDFTGYIGPKFVDTLTSVNKELADVAQYGVGTFFAKNLFFVLDWFYKVVGNWGVAIILLVVLIRLVLFPLTYKGMVSMYKLKELAPKMKEIQQKYKKDPQKLQMHMMKLYKEHGANPLGGCLPLVLQIPVFYGIYKLLLYAIELKGATFLWIHDLSLMDPYFILPVLMGASMYLHQRLTPTNFQDPMQEKVFKFLPLIFTFMMATFPAGLVLYWTTNNILSIAQQWFINRVMASKAKK
jgi:YidC/Oxa1 family membrane protein insertase